MPFYLVFIICLYCTYHVSPKSALFPIHDITDRDMAGLSYEEQLDYKRQKKKKQIK